jgi:signal peptidase II
MADRRIVAFSAAAAIFALDRLTKYVVETHVSFFDTYKVIPGFFDIVRSQNRGVAFGIFNDSTSQWSTALLIVASLVAVAAVSTMLWKADRLDTRSLWGFALILGGAAGNVFDRIVWGRVTDFLLVYVRDWQWPTFNLADSAIVVGSCLLLLDLLRSKPQGAPHVS